MPGRPIGAVTFDLWDCLFCDDTDEPKRAAAGEAPKPEARRALLYDALRAEAPIGEELVWRAYDVADAAFNKVWRELHVTWTVRERLELALRGLGRTLSESALDALVRAHEDMELAFRPDPAPGALEALRALHGRYPLAVISDAIFSPGRSLRALLDGAGMLRYFDALVFSDELGRSKPHRAVFDAAARECGVAVESLVHIGDRPHNDIGGAHAAGARCVLLTVVKNRPLEGHAPDAVCEDYARLPEVLASLER